MAAERESLFWTEPSRRMNDPQQKPATVFALRAALEQSRETACDQLGAAWQLQVARAQEQLAAGWHQSLEHVFRERFEEIAAGLEADFQRAVNERVTSSVEAAVTLARDLARRELTELLNRNARRFSQAETSAGFTAALLEAVTEFSERAILLSVTPHRFRYEGAKPFAGNLQSLLGAQEFYLRDAAALANAVESRDTVVAMKRPGELGESLTAALREGEPEDGKVYLFPVVTNQESGPRVELLVVAEGDDSPVDVNAVELLCAVAGAALEARNNAGNGTASTTAADLVTITPGSKQEAAVDWSSLPREEQDAHLRAQRFARVQVAEMRLYKSDLVKQGRAEKNLYGRLREDMDRSREAYQQQYLKSVPSMVDYLHLEIHKTLANDDGSLLGPDYPGPLG
jgi:hypothetical protein